MTVEAGTFDSAAFFSISDISVHILYFQNGQNKVAATGIARGNAFPKREIYQPHDFLFPSLKNYQLAPWVMEKLFKSMLA